MSAQQFSFVFGTISTQYDPPLEIPPTTIRMPITTNGSSTVFTASATYNTSSSQSPFQIFFSRGSNTSIKIYVDKSTTDDDYFDPICIRASDIVYLTGFILGNMTFSTSQKVAADVNIDGVISFADIITMQRAILGLDEKLVNSLTIDGTTHSNLSAVYPTTDELIPLNNPSFSTPYTCVYSYNPLTTSLIGRNFTAIRLGDLNENCDNFFTD